MNNYFVLYNNGHYANIHAKDLEGCIVVFAKYTNDYSDLFVKALSGCNSTEDYVNMYNHFSQTHIDSIFLIKEIVYENRQD